MKLLNIMILSLFMVSNSSAAPNYSDIFANVEPCFTLYDLNQGKTIESFNKDRCNERISPCSTFKIPLSLMGFDSGIFKSEDSPKWDFKPEYNAVIEIHAKDHTPKTWMANSVVWYSQLLTQKLGIDKFTNYVAKLSYGNQDLSGNKGKNDGLTRSWLGSSLKISANEQIEFLRNLKTNNLPVSKAAIKHTENILFVEDLPDGWKLYGKTGSASDTNADGSKNDDIQIGWFIGFLEKSGQTYIFAINIHDKQKFTEYAGRRAKAMAKEIFASLDVLK